MPRRWSGTDRALICKDICRAAGLGAEPGPVEGNTAASPLSTKTLTFVTGVPREHLKTIGSRWRKLRAVPL